MIPVAITGHSAYLPDADRAAAVLGRKGLRYKEPATRLALCAVHRALGVPDGQWLASDGVDADTAVVGCGNLGNVGTVVDVVRDARAGGWRDVSPMAAPNASSNVLASTVAIWFGFGGPNLMLCSGATTGLDALGIAAGLLAARRAARVVVVGAEPADPVAVALHERRVTMPAPLQPGAGCLVLEPADRAGPGAVLLGPVRDEPTGEPAPVDHYGATGVIRAALAVDELARDVDRDELTVWCGDAADGWRSVTVRRNAQTRQEALA